MLVSGGGVESDWALLVSISTLVWRPKRLCDLLIDVFTLLRLRSHVSMLFVVWMSLVVAVVVG